MGLFRRLSHERFARPQRWQLRVFLGLSCIDETELKYVMNHHKFVLALQEAEAAKEEAEQRFWLPLERSKGRQMGELCVSLLFTKVPCCIAL